MNALVIYESLTGNTKKTAEEITKELSLLGINADNNSITNISMQHLSDADIVIIGSWTDGIIITGQKPGRAGRLKAMPSLAGKQAIVYCTYAINPGKTLSKMETIVEGLGAEVIGGVAIKRTQIDSGASELAAKIESMLVNPVVKAKSL